MKASFQYREPTIFVIIIYIYPKTSVYVHSFLCIKIQRGDYFIRGVNISLWNIHPGVKISWGWIFNPTTALPETCQNSLKFHIHILWRELHPKALFQNDPYLKFRVIPCKRRQEVICLLNTVAPFSYVTCVLCDTPSQYYLGKHFVMTMKFIICAYCCKGWVFG